MQDLAKIVNYFVEEKDCTEMVAGRLATKLTKYDDIKSEFLQWLKTGKYDIEKPLEVEGYTAAKIHEMVPVLDGSGVYNFMVTLREDPKRAQEIIAEGFVEK